MMTPENYKKVKEQMENVWVANYGLPAGKIDEMKTVEIVPSEPQKVVDLASYTFSGTLTLESFKLSETAKNLFSEAAVNPPVDIVIQNTETRAGAKPLRSHKKRLVKKWRKKNTIVVKETLFKGCTIVGGDF